MPPLTKKDLEKVNRLSRIFPDEYPTFIETGTKGGGTVLGLEPYFERLHTIEIKDEFHRAAKAGYDGDKISFHLGDSALVLPRILELSSGNLFIFLDAHWSSGDTGRGPVDVPLLEELEAIANYKGKSLVVIDDYRLFGKGPNRGGCLEDWENISKPAIKEIVGSRLYANYHISSDIRDDDRYILDIQ